MDFGDGSDDETGGGKVSEKGSRKPMAKATCGTIWSSPVFDVWQRHTGAINGEYPMSV